jgi:outer membrane receptor protein involved in Fe transport
VRDVNNYQNGSDYRISLSQSIVRGDQIFGRWTGGSSGTSTRISWLPILVLSRGSDYASDSFFINDRWGLNKHWTFNLGLRYDKNARQRRPHLPDRRRLGLQPAPRRPLRPAR